MRLFIALGLFWLVTGESVQDIATDQSSQEPTIREGLSGLNEQNTQTNKKEENTEDHLKINNNNNKNIETKGDTTSHTDKNGMPITTIDFSSNLQPDFEIKSITDSKHSPVNAEESNIDSKKGIGKLSEESTPLMNDDSIHELSVSFEESKVIFEEGSEETDSAGVIHGKYTYTLERDGIPRTIEYEASPETGFVVKQFYKQAVDKANDISKLKLKISNPLDTANSKAAQDRVTPDYKIDPFEDNVPIYEHSTILGRYKPRFRRSEHSTMRVVPQSTIKSPSPLGEDSINPVIVPIDREILAKISKAEIADESESSQPEHVDASYRFGFSLDSRSRNEESDGKGNVKGSYSYVDYDGLMTKVEYEAGANKGFVVKRISHEQLEPVVQTEPKHSTKTLRDVQQKAYDDIETEPETYSDEFISETSPVQLKIVPGIIDQENQGPSLDNDYSAQDNKGFSEYGLPTQDEHFIPPVDLAIRRAVAISDKDNQQLNNKRRNRNFRKVVMRRPKKPIDNGNFMTIMPDGSYSFAYQTNDHSRRESVDTLGNVHSSYQYTTKRDGTTLVVFDRKVSKNDAINKQVDVNSRQNNILNQPISPVLDDEYISHSNNPTDVLKIDSKRIRKHSNGVADLIMRNSRV